MAVLFTSFSEIDSVIDVCTGFHLEENVQGSGQIPVRNVIFNDYLSVQDPLPTVTFLSAVYVPLVFVQSFNPLTTKMFGGNPTVYKFGTLVADQLGTNGVRQFIQYEKQQFPIQELLVYPEPLPFPDNMSALPEPEAYEGVFRSPLASNRVFVGKASPFTSSVFFSYDLEKDVIANIGFFYYAFINTAGSLGAGTILYVGI